MHFILHFVSDHQEAQRTENGGTFKHTYSKRYIAITETYTGYYKTSNIHLETGFSIVCLIY